MTRATSEQIASRQIRMLETLTACAEHGRACPSAYQFGHWFHCHTNAVADCFKALRRSGLIAYRFEKGKGLHPRYRIVTICATGKRTGAPTFASPKAAADSFLPTPRGCPVRILQGKEKAHWIAIYMQREAELAAKRKLWTW